MNSTVIATRSFLQLDDISAKVRCTVVLTVNQSQVYWSSHPCHCHLATKFSTTARVDGEMDVSGIGSIAVEDATIAFAFGLGVVEISDKIYFADIKNIATTLKKNAQWQHVAVMDVNLPVVAAIELGGLELSLSPIISITSSDLLSLEPPLVRIDLSMEYVLHFSFHYIDAAGMKQSSDCCSLLVTGNCFQKVKI